VSPVKLGLSPVLPGTEKRNGDNNLEAIRAFVPGVPGVLVSPPEGNPADQVPELAGCVALLVSQLGNGTGHCRCLHWGLFLAV